MSMPDQGAGGVSGSVVKVGLAEFAPQGDQGLKRPAAKKVDQSKLRAGDNARTWESTQDVFPGMKKAC